MDVPALRRKLLRWYDANKRDLPWRRSQNPYATWVSEIMLQQTRVDVVVPYFERWMAKFPTVQALAAADPEDVLRLWSGLGYYTRARNLQAAANIVVAKHGGNLPATVEDLRELPGIGPYTAAAIASIAFGQPAAVVDGNVERVVARLALLRGNLKTAKAAKTIRALAQGWLASRRPGDWNQAVMDLGATVCTPRSPRCGECPVASHCLALPAGLAGTLPENRRPATAKLERRRFAVIQERGRILLVRNPDKGLLAGMWSLPGGRMARPLCDVVNDQTGLRVVVKPRPARARHQFSHRTWDMAVHHAARHPGVPSRPATSAQSKVRWIATSDLANEALPVAMRTALAAVGIPAKTKRRATSAGVP